MATRTVFRSCNLCEAHCGVGVELDGDAVRTVRGDPDDTFSRGYICPKAYGLKALQEDPDRLRRPLIREGDRFREASWREALDLVVSKLRAVRDAHGSDAIATYLGNPTAHDFAATFYVPVFLRALQTKWRFSATSVDQLPKMVSSQLLFGGSLAIPIADIDHTDFLLVLGANPLASNGSLMTAPDFPGRLDALKRRGGRLVVVDPRRSETAAIADEHVAIRPGTDALWLFALVHVLFEEGLVRLGRLEAFTDGVDRVRALARDFAPETVAAATGVPAETTRRIARAFASAPTAACYGRIGTCTQEFGTLASWLVDVVNVLTGNLDRPGGSLFPLPAHTAADGRADGSARGARGGKKPSRVPYARWKSRVRGLPEFGGELPVATLAEEIDAAGDQRIRALVTLAGNPVLSTPNGARLARAIESLDFVVSIDIYQNETTRLADVILPTTAPLERTNYDMVFHGFSVRNVAKWSPAALPKPVDAKHGWELLLEIGAGVNGATAEQLDELFFSGLLANAVGKPGTACAHVSQDEARAKLGKEMGPERLLDLLLRAGAYGDRFEDDGDGLSLAKLQAAVHGVDLGPLASRLPAMLATESGKIELAPDLLVADVARLRASLAAPRDGFVLIGRRHLRSNNSWFHNLPALAKGKERCTLMVHPDDAQALGLAAGSRARVQSRVGAVEAPVEITDAMRRGVVSLPHGFGHDAPGARLGVAATRPGVNSNVLTDETLLDTLSCNAVLNGIPVEIAPA
jgi:anaerobic selenocysteine-containing dehydrogenase